jgi:F-type H+-transporting ATPase subunit delta
MKSSDRILARRYARAFITGQGSDFTELSTFQGLIAPLLGYFDNPLIPLEIKNRLLAERLNAHADTRAFRFMRLLLNVKRFYLLGQILADCADILDGENGIARAEITSAFEPDLSVRTAIENRLSEITGKRVLAKFKENAELIAGMQIRMGDTFVDGSVKGKLEQLKNRING